MAWLVFGKVSKRVAELLLLLLMPVDRIGALPRKSSSGVSGIEKDIGDVIKSSNSVVKSVSAEDRGWSEGKRRVGNRAEDVPDDVD